MVTTLKDLERLLKILRKQGVVNFKHGEIELKLGDLPETEQRVITEQNAIPSENPYADFPDGLLSPEQLMYYSAGGDPENDPENPANQQ